jgi:hypothetical protein
MMLKIVYVLTCRILSLVTVSGQRYQQRSWSEP